MAARGARARRRERRRKSGIINMRISKADRELIDSAARVLGVTRSSLIRHAAEAQARRVLAITETK